jgi:GNAT superfamily N-acetyltransferase
MTVTYEVSPALSDELLNALFASAWPAHPPTAFARVLEHSLLYVAAFAGDRLVGFVNVATDGGAHAFLLDPTVDPAHRHQGIGTRLVRMAADGARDRGCEWLHVDYEPELAAFYTGAGFRPTAAGVMRLMSVSR